MGLSSSQARLLHLTGRMHQIEYNAAKLEAEKLQMANESRRVYLDYQNALEATKIQRATLNTDGSLNYVDATYNALLKDGYRLGKCEYMAVSQDDIDTFNSVADSNPAEFAAIKSGYAVKNGNDITLAKDPTIHLAFTAEQLKAYTTAGNNIVLMDDINVTESMGTLTSSLNGNGHTINVSGNNGIFGTINNGTVQNLKINANITTNAGQDDTVDAHGALANYAIGTSSFENITLSGTIKNAGVDTGGLIGATTQNQKSTLNFNNISLDISLNANENEKDGGFGGVIGYNYISDINISNVSGNVNINSNSHSGGILGCSTTGKININNCNINSNITANSCINSANEVVSSCTAAGGIIGYGWSSQTTINNCNVTGSIKSYKDRNKNASAGGIIGQQNSGGTIGNCTANVSVFAETSADGSTYAGNIVGNCPNVTVSQTATNANPTAPTPTYYNPSDEATVNGETSSTVGADYDHYLEIGQAIADDKYFLIDGHEDDTEWLTNLVNSGFVTIQKKDEDGNYFDTSVSTDTHLQEVADETGLRKAEAKYEADMKRIDNKDKKFDYDLAALDNERNAIKQEMETLQTVAKDNVERTFKLFS